MKNLFAFLVLSILSISLLSLAGCKKTNNTENDYTNDFTMQSEDETFISAEDDFVSNEVNLLIEAESTFSGRTSNPICDATISHSITATARLLTITYSGQSCWRNRTRTGTVVLTIPKEKKWKDAGSQVSVTYQNFTINRTGDNKSVVLNGTKTVTNVTGGNFANLANLRTITHTLTSSALNITFPDGTKRTWQIAKQRVFTYNNGIVISTTGTHTDGTTSKISAWGTNRGGKPFSTQIAEPIVIRQDCDFRIVSGKTFYSNLEKPVTLTFGLNASGVSSACPGSGRYFYKMEWLGSQNTPRSVILPY